LSVVAAPEELAAHEAVLDAIARDTRFAAGWRAAAATGYAG